VPELPEVETIVEGLRPRIVGRRIESLELRRARRVAIGDLGRAQGRRIRSLRRYGKHILFELDRGLLVVHLGMTGQLLLDGEIGRHTHAIFGLEGGRTLLYNDARQFGRLEWTLRLPERLQRLGPEPLEIGREEFVRRFRSRRTMAKALLLDQRFLRGVGNIYADEALFRAGVHPRAKSERLPPARAAALHRAIVGVLKEAIRLGGSSISDYVASDGSLGSFQVEHRVYGRAGEPCVTCGSRLRRILVASRGTHFCPRCQRTRQVR